MIKTPQADQWVEGTNFTLLADPGVEDTWLIRIETGDFIETQIRYNSVRFDEQNLMMHFNFDLVYTPDSDLKAEDAELQKAAAGILHSILLRMLDEPTKDPK